MSTENLNQKSPDSQIPKKEESTFFDAYANLSEEQFTRGSTIPDVASKSLDLCRAYIGGSWLLANGPEDLEIKRIAFGLTNQLYRVALKSTVPSVGENSVYPEQPRTVAIKFYQSKHLTNYSKELGEEERLNDIIVLTILSQVGLGPKVFGHFPGGVIQEFSENENFRLKHQKQPEMVRKLIAALARVNNLNVPLRKLNNWNIEEMRKGIETGLNTPEVPYLIQELKLEKLSTCDLRQELAEFEQAMLNLAPVKVFCHNDFRGDNILVDNKDQSIKLVDLEYSSYGNRGYDISSYSLEWGRENFDFQNLSLPTDELINHLVSIYIEECDKLIPGYASKPENSLLTIQNEVKLSVLNQFLFFFCWIFRQSESYIDAVPFDRKKNLRYCENTLKSYLEAKEHLIKEGIFVLQKSE